MCKTQYITIPRTYLINSQDRSYGHDHNPKQHDQQSNYLGHRTPSLLGELQKTGCGNDESQRNGCKTPLQEETKAYPWSIELRGRGVRFNGYQK